MRMILCEEALKLRGTLAKPLEAVMKTGALCVVLLLSFVPAMAQESSRQVAEYLLNAWRLGENGTPYYYDYRVGGDWLDMGRHVMGYEHLSSAPDQSSWHLYRMKLTTEQGVAY